LSSILIVPSYNPPFLGIDLFETVIPNGFSYEESAFRRQNSRACRHFHRAHGCGTFWERYFFCLVLSAESTSRWTSPQESSIDRRSPLGVNLLTRNSTWIWSHTCPGAAAATIGRLYLSAVPNARHSTLS